MWIKQPIGHEYFFKYAWRVEPLQGVGQARLKKHGPVLDVDDFRFSATWANCVKALLCEDPTPFDYETFFNAVEGHYFFGPFQGLATSTIGWAGEFLGLLAYIKIDGLSARWNQVCRVTQVSGLRKYPDFGIYNFASNSLKMLECKSSFKPLRPGLTFLDVCGTLDKRRKDGVEKSKKGHTWYKDANGHKVHIAPLPAHGLAVVALCFVDHRFGKHNLQPIACNHAKANGCVDACLAGASSQCHGMVGIFQNPLRRLEFQTPLGNGTSYFSALQRFQRAVWVASPLMFNDALEGLFNTLPKGKKSLDGLVSYIVQVAFERFNYSFSNRALELLSEVEAQSMVGQELEVIQSRQTPPARDEQFDVQRVLSGNGISEPRFGQLNIGEAIWDFTIVGNSLRAVRFDGMNEMIEAEEWLRTNFQSKHKFSVYLSGPSFGGVDTLPIFLYQAETDFGLLTALLGEDRLTMKVTPLST